MFDVCQCCTGTAAWAVALAAATGVERTTMLEEEVNFRLTEQAAAQQTKQKSEAARHDEKRLMRSLKLAAAAGLAAIAELGQLNPKHAALTAQCAALEEAGAVGKRDLIAKHGCAMRETLMQHSAEKQRFKKDLTSSESRLAALKKENMIVNEARTKLKSVHAIEITALKRKHARLQDGNAKVEEYCVTMGSRNDKMKEELASLSAKADNLMEELDDAQGRQQDMIQFDRRRCDYISLLKQQLLSAGLKPAADPMG
jgi:chromosome segregation ATPase